MYIAISKLYLIKNPKQELKMSEWTTSDQAFIDTGTYKWISL